MRGFEQVSPQVKGADVEIGGVARAAEGGGGVAFQSFGSLAGAVSRVHLNEFRSLRTGPGQWSTVSLNPPYDVFPGVVFAQVFQALSPDVTVGVAKSWGSKDFGRPQMRNLWRVNAPEAPGAGVSFDLLSEPLGLSVPAEIPPVDASSGNDFGAGSEDLGHVVFGSSHRLVLDAPAEPPHSPGGGFEDGRYLYEWTGGQLRLVNVLPDGSFAARSVVGYGSPTAQLFYPGEFAVSADGSRIFFSTTDSPSDGSRELYVRQVDAGVAGGRVSVHVSMSERTDCAGDPTCGGDFVPDPAPDPDLTAPKAALFQVASADGGGPALFLSPQKLTDDVTESNGNGIGVAGGSTFCAFARCELYRWDPAMDEGERLLDLTAGAGGGGAGVLGTVGASRDLSRVFFVAIGALADGAVDGRPNVYVWEEGRPIRFIATLDGEGGGGLAGDEGVWSRKIIVGNVDGNNNFGGGVRVGGDGRFLVFRSRARITGYDNAGQYQLYRYDVLDGSLVCVSCNPRAAASTGNAYLKQQSRRAINPPWVSRSVSPDGDVVFDSDEALVGSDVNGVSDVYEWSGGQVRLVSSGTGGSASQLLDVSASGADVFFTTRDRLVWSDRDNLVDVYDARVGGGPPPPPPGSGCRGDACQGVLPTAPGVAQPGAPVGSGNAKPRKAKPRRVRCRKGFVRKRVGGKVRCVKKKPRRSARRGGRAR